MLTSCEVYFIVLGSLACYDYSMDTTAQNQQSSSGMAQQGQPVTPMQNGQSVQTVQQPTQSVPVNPVGKETPPIPAQKPQEWIAETPSEMVLPKEAQEVGAEVTHGEVLQVDPTVASEGVVSTGTATPLPTDPALKFPMTEEKAEGIVKMHKKVKDSIYWLAMLIVRQFKILKSQKKSNTGEIVAEPVQADQAKEAA